MFSLNKITIFIFSFMQLVNSQGLQNSFSIGGLNQMKGSQALEHGVLPNFRYDISLNNSATWPKLKFTQLSLKYKGIENSGDSKNIISDISLAKLIIPFKDKNAIGVALEPYSDQTIILNDSIYAYKIFFNDTIQSARNYLREGGLFSFQTGIGRIMNDKISIGLNLNYVFGSSRNSESLVIDQISTIQKFRYRYSGIFFQGYANFYLNNKAAFFFSMKRPLKNLRTIYEKYHLFEDINGNGFQDNYGDFPSLSDVKIPNQLELDQVIHSPKEFIFGFEKKMKNKIILNAQLSNYEDDGQLNKNYKNEIHPIIISSSTVSFGILKFPDQLSTLFRDKFIFRLGLDYRNANISNGILMTEFGYSLGISYKFKALSNQIDFIYFGGGRSYESNFNEETFQQLQVGVTIADLWFVKRRQRRNE